MSQDAGPAPVLGGSFESAMQDASVLGTSEPNAHYYGQRLQYSEGVETFDAGAALIVRAMSELKSHMLMSFLLWSVGVLVAIVFGMLGGLGLGVLVLIATMLFCLALLTAPFIRRHSFPISEWKLLIDGKGFSADAVYDHIAAALVERESPTQYRAVQLPDIWWRGYLQVRMGAYSGFITCFAFGRDLYIGWTLWFSMSWVAYRRANRQGGVLALLTLPWRIVSDMLSGRANTYELAYVHQYDEAKALRECLHAVTRQGVEAATGIVPLRGKGTIGSTVPEGEAPHFATSSTFRATDGQRHT